MANSNTPSRGSGQLTKFTKWNVKGLIQPVKRTKVLAHLKLLKTDIAFLTEAHMRGSHYVGLKRMGGTGLPFNFSEEGQGGWHFD